MRERDELQERYKIAVHWWPEFDRWIASARLPATSGGVIPIVEARGRTAAEAIEALVKQQGWSSSSL